MSLRAAAPAKSPSRRPDAVEGPERLQKILAAAGLGSRRQCEELILAGRVEVAGRVVKELGTKADRKQQEVRVDGQPLSQPRLVHFMVNKPSGVLSTNSDPSGRPRVIDLIDYTGRLFTVGRLDMSSEGLILVTNDGELANQLTHPRYGVEKTYQVEIAGAMDRKELDTLRKGVHLAEGFARVVSAKVKHQYKQSTLVEIVLNEGRNREIRRLLARVGHKVMRLKRVAIGPLRLAQLPIGHVRLLDREEIRALRQAAHGVSHKRPRQTTRSSPGRGAAKPPQPKRAIIGGDRPAKRGFGEQGSPSKNPRARRARVARPAGRRTH